jgi:hypothetical protein
VGLGQDDSQSHTFPCRNCGEEISIRLDIDHQRAATKFVSVKNCSVVKEEPGAEIVNLEANFLLTPEEQRQDFVIPRLRQVVAMAEASANQFAKSGLVMPNLKTAGWRPDYAAEWQDLERAWSLTRRKQNDLAQKIIESASAQRYADAPLSSLGDWLWKFTASMGGFSTQAKVSACVSVTKPLANTSKVKDFSSHYGAISKEHGLRYFEVFREFFNCYGEFSQIFLYYSAGLDVPMEHRATSSNFSAVRRFYGDCFENFAVLVEFLAFINNICEGRNWNTFERLKFHEYRELDKPNRFNAFAKNSEFSALCGERDNRIRNGSHHASFTFDPESQTVKYRSGKGGTGPEQSMPYADYLDRCCRIFLQVVALFRLELMVAAGYDYDLPV